MSRSKARVAGLFPARNVGHTHLMLEGLRHFKGRCVLVSRTAEHAEKLAKEVERENPDIKIEPRGLDDPPLRGQYQGIAQALDNSALMQLLYDLNVDLHELERLRKGT